MAKTIISILLLIKSLFISLCVCLPQQTNANNTIGFSVELIHRDSPQSPLYDPSLSHTQTIVNAIRRSLDRFQWLNESHIMGSTETDVVRSIHSGDYLMRYAIGQQRVPSLGVLDTGSGLIWTQCFPCSGCIKQNPPLYKPGHSYTYEKILCNAFECNRSGYATLCQQKNLTHCLYSLSYADGTLSQGYLSKDTFILASAGGTTTGVPNIVFGCAHKAKSKFYGYESGVIGLGRNPESLVSQLGYLAKGKFSYCLVSRSEQPKRSISSRLHFGDNAEVSGDGAVHTPLVFNPKYPTFYYVTLLGFTITGGPKYMYSYNDGNFIVDSGWMETRLPDDMYNQLKKSLMITFKYFNKIDDPEDIFDFCIETPRDDLWLPTVTLHLKGDGADVSFGKDNMFIRTSPNSLCLAVKPAGEKGFAIFGYLAQANFIVGYDNDKNLMSFKPADCTKPTN